jgi:hypothetical protein
MLGSNPETDVVLVKFTKTNFTPLISGLRGCLD